VFIGVVVIAVGVNLLSSYVVAQDWAWLPPALFVAALLVAVPSAGLLRRERYGTTRARAMALLALTGYLAVTVWGSVTGWPLAFRVGAMLLGVAVLLDRWPLVGVPSLLFGIAALPRRTCLGTRRPSRRVREDRRFGQLAVSGQR
jgi:hypothetical protein